MSDTSGPRDTAVVIGGGMTGMLAASALSLFADVVIVERDALPAGPEPRKGLPQARHAHLLWAGGVAALEALLPCIGDRLVERGAWRAGIMTDLVSKAPSGPWFRRFATPTVNLVCSRDLLDATVRWAVLRDERVSVRGPAEVVGLVGTASRITGVRVHTGGNDETIPATIVVDAGGRGSRAAVWLEDLGIPPVPERTVDAGVVYASRMFKAPGSTAGEFPIVNVQADPGRAPGQGGIILPIEDGRWLVTLSGTRGGEPTGDPDSFVGFAKGLRHPVIGDLIERAEPLTDPVMSRSTANTRRYFEKAAEWPEGFVVVGDAVAAYNPVYGHGLTAAAQGAVAIDRTILKHGLHREGLSRRLQRAVARPVGNAWNLAVGQDVLYPGATAEGPTAADRFGAALVDRAVDAGARSPRAQRYLLEVMSMQKPPTRLLSPGMLLRMAMGKKRPHLDGPPLTAAERSRTAPAS
ncbi:pyridine nucleotide-disulfide oxidoreductase [Streptomyces sp. BPPL-273]|uniref:FAD-dependent oxidoreductase n=1 Tax=Streptomyces TaxID=1883 RepID=UPI00210AE95A|nr:MULTISPECIES: FAD-dependent monooxygenase [Streptomyces]MCQ4198322.1 pyridine nucleotide-disulfide oxidoreductase [Streptomyces parvulus]WHM33240.1 pyridine nucleotide-disulfide oxidoreductase [Streptomyces sp. BPPL-273]